ncbi:MAG: MFS transporter [Candidatus ainarchaeum sp.]|nr:MFS transporter [Candidatus ainarchaeum sp.]
MKKLALLMLVVFLSAAFAAGALNVSEAVKQAEQGAQGAAITSSSPFYSTGILSQWKELSILLAFIMVLLVGVARMIAEPLNLPDLKAWANVEWAQTIVTVVIVLAAMGCLVFVDAVVADEVNKSPGSPVQCSSSDFCLIKVSNVYLDGLINLSEESSRSAFVASVSAGSTASQRQTFSCGTLLVPPCLWGYISWANNGFLILDVERYNQEIEMFSSIIYGLSVQYFFVNQIAYLVGPVLLLVGIVGRSFFLTRRAGGMLMAVALGIMFVFPMMYLWNMITLNVSVYGDRLFQAPNADCPKECGLQAPIAYSIADNSKGYDNISEIIGTCTPQGPETCPPPEDTQRAIIEGLKDGSLPHYNDAGSCENKSLEINTTHKADNDANGEYYCPSYCRELPYPYSIAECSLPKTELACMELPRGCKVVREVVPGTTDICNSVDAAGKSTPICPDYCKVVPPLDADCTSCFKLNADGKPDAKNPVSAPFNCRVAFIRYTIGKDGTIKWPNDDEVNSAPRPDSCTQSVQGYPNDYVDATKNCKASTTAEDSCSYIVPQMPDCECVGPECCIYAAGVSECMDPYKTDSGGEITIITSPNSDSEGGDPQQEVSGTDIITNWHYDCTDETQSTCLNYTGARFWNNQTSTCQCNGRNCSMPSTICNSCLDVPKDYCFFKPYVELSCSQDCTGGSFLKPVLLTPAEFARKSSEGMFGRDDIKNVSRLLLPAFLLPLINIAVTLMFIRGFSPIFGGDFEIPGYAKVL